MGTDTIIRAYSKVEFKAGATGSDGKRRFTGIATTPSTDSIGDIVEPKGMQITLPTPLLWQHNSREPIGWVRAARVTAKGIEVDCEVAEIDPADSPELAAEINKRWAQLKSGLVGALSIGFRSLEAARIEGTYGYRYLKSILMELSTVTIPANGDCSITAIKSADLAIQRAASGDMQVRSIDPGRTATTPSPGVSGSTNQPAKSGLFSVPKGINVNIAEQLAAFEASRAEKQAKADALMAKSAETASVLDEHDEEAYDTLQKEIQAINKHLERLKSHEATMVAKATPVAITAGQGQGAVEIRGTGPLSVRRNIAKGVTFARYAMALARANGNIMHAEQLAKSWTDTPEVSLLIGEIVKHGNADMLFKTAVAAGTTTDSTWAGPLVYAQNMVTEFIEFLRPKTVLGKMPSLRKVPFNVRIPRQTAGTSGSFVGEGLPIPVGKLALDSITLTWAKASTIVVLTQELVRNSNPAAEGLVRDDLVKGISQYLDRRFIDPSYPGVANVSPASVSNGVTSRQASGVTLAAIDADVNYLFTQMAASELDMSTCVWVMQPATAISLSSVRTTYGDLAFPDINVNGGTFKGFPVIVSNNVTSAGSPGEQQVFLVCQDEILLSDDGQMLLDMSSEASLQMNDAPSAGAQSLVSMYQTDQVALKVDRWINWARRRSAAVQYIEQTQRWGS